MQWLTPSEAQRRLDASLMLVYAVPYGIALIEMGAAAADVTVRGNYYLPLPPVIFGGSDSAPATQAPPPLVP